LTAYPGRTAPGSGFPVADFLWRVFCGGWGSQTAKPAATVGDDTDAIRLFIFSDIFIISHVSKGLRFTHGNSK
jgi:hypothetical protein